MKFKALPVTREEDVTLNFEQLQGAFGFPVYTAAPVYPFQGQTYFDTTLHQIGVWTGTAWHYV